LADLMIWRKSLKSPVFSHPPIPCRPLNNNLRKEWILSHLTELLHLIISDGTETQRGTFTLRLMSEKSLTRRVSLTPTKLKNGIEKYTPLRHKLYRSHLCTCR
jgi:hypothetical protein